MPMSSWESVVGRICRICHKNLATHWFGCVPICCKCHGGYIFDNKEAEKEHLEVMKSLENKPQLGD